MREGNIRARRILTRRALLIEQRSTIGARYFVEAHVMREHPMIVADSTGFGGVERLRVWANRVRRRAGIDEKASALAESDERYEQRYDINGGGEHSWSARACANVRMFRRESFFHTRSVDSAASCLYLCFSVKMREVDDESGSIFVSEFYSIFPCFKGKPYASEGGQMPGASIDRQTLRRDSAREVI